MAGLLPYLGVCGARSAPGAGEAFSTYLLDIAVTIRMVHKTTVYIEDSQAERLGRLASASGRSQAELIREGLERVLSEAPARTFRSMGKGRSGDKGERRWDAEELYRKTRGEPNR